MHGFVERVAPHGKLNVDLKASASGGTEDGRERTHHEPDMRIGAAGTLERSPELQSVVSNGPSGLFMYRRKPKNSCTPR
jgi:hypothetical protein